MKNNRGIDLLPDELKVKSLRTNEIVPEYADAMKARDIITKAKMGFFRLEGLGKIS